MRITLILLTLLFLGFVLMVAYLYLNQRKLLYYPQALDRSWSHIQQNEDVEFRIERDGIQLKGWLLNPDQDRLLVYYGGNGEEVSWNIEEFSRLSDFSVLLMNYRGYGESGGVPTETNLVGDAKAILRGLEDRYQSIVLVGRSLGSGIAVQVAAVVEVDSIVLVTPYDSIVSVAKGMYPFVPVSRLLKDRYDSVKAAANTRAPALFLVAENDTIIPVKHSRQLFEMWKGETRWVEVAGTDHNSISQDPLYWDHMVDFIRLPYAFNRSGETRR